MKRRRALVAAVVAAAVVAGMLWADALTLQRANPSFHNEERNFSNLARHEAQVSTTTTTSPRATSTTSPRHATSAG